MLRPPHQDRDLVLATDHAAIGEDVAAAVGSIPLRHRKLVKIDVVAFDHVLLHRAGLDHFRRQALREDIAAEPHQLAGMGVWRQAEHHGDAASAREPSGENLPTTGIGAVVTDIAEQERRPGAGALREARNRAELDIPIDFGVDALQFAGAVERLDPTAQIAKRYWLSLARHCLSGPPSAWRRRSSLSLSILSRKAGCVIASEAKESRKARVDWIASSLRSSQ